MNKDILFIDDDEDLALVAMDLFENRGLTCMYARDAQAAEDLMYRHRFSLIVLDINLPGEGGSAQDVERAVRQVLDSRVADRQNSTILSFLTVFLAGDLALLFYFYLRIIRPFRRMETFAEEVARGNLDAPLKLGRKNLFGSFTWAFDCMREDLKAAKEKEAKALENNRTMIAAISHDIKTPIAGIRAYCEGLTQMPDATPKRRQRYLSVIMRKCDEVTGLTDDLFLSAIHDMDRLQVNAAPVPARQLFESLSSVWDASKLVVTDPESIPDVEILADEARMLEILENLVRNTQKYAGPSPLRMDITADLDTLMCDVWDEGPGIPDEDMPFVLQKFYRGKNGLDEPGAGLGLYICKTLMEQMGGGISLDNRGGLHVYLTFCTAPETNPQSNISRE